MTIVLSLRKILSVSLSVFLSLSLLSACNDPRLEEQADNSSPDSNYSNYIVVIEEDSDTVDFQCTSLYYTVALNCFNRLVETESMEDGSMKIMPSLAESWEVSENGLSYTFHLRDGIRFSNDSPLTSSDVLYSFTRLLTHPDSVNYGIAESILGGSALRNGAAEHLEGFHIVDDLTFVITLEQPFAAFLACLSMPGASILDEETTIEAGDRFGRDPAWTIGTGPFIMEDWEIGKCMHMKANKNCWQGPPASEGLELLFITGQEELRTMFEDGRLDILDLNDLDDSAEFFMHGDIYQDRLQEVQQLGITYIALNQAIGPLRDVRVRKALQLSLNRQILLDAVYSGRGTIENGIFPKGLFGYNPDLPEIPYDPETARQLLAEAGYPNGFNLPITVRSSSAMLDITVLRLAASMWDDIGVQTSIEVISESEFMEKRREGMISCYTATWIADYDDPDNFISTFFGSYENTRSRSLCYRNLDIIERVSQAKSITDETARINEYHDLEEKIIQEDASWIPLFSRTRFYVCSERLEGFHASWNGSVKNNYRLMSIRE